ncbi:MAG: SpoIID/LytB domain-containing protein [Deltaproteobacteria bacterium]|nr:SpoIID/LytB domain-containing protein [Deltaproteobacteria bacterium]
MTAYGKVEADTAVVRVLMVEKANRLVFSAKAGITLTDVLTGRTLSASSRPLVITRSGSLLQVGGSDGFRIMKLSSSSERITLNQKQWRGVFTVSCSESGLQAINHVPLEDYLYGIVPAEMPCTWASEALRAQAVASRTYALYAKIQRCGMSWDLKATISSQVYGGVGAETLETTRAVNATRGVLMTIKNRPIMAYFHANSAGHTEDARNVWDVDIPYLTGTPDRFSENIPGDTWQYLLTHHHMTSRLQNAGWQTGKIMSVLPNGISPTGRVQKVRLVMDKGTIDLTGNQFRLIFGSTRIKSTYFKLTGLDEGILLKGRGYGHGVGMSQWGACRMAEQGFKYQQILWHYYPGVSIG